MRDIKFRIWDGKKIDNILGFAYNHQSRYDIENNIKTISVYFENRNYEVFNIGFNKDAELMQYTGLKDKNGKEIYEGDILKLGNTSSFVAWCLDGWRFNSYMERGELDLYTYVDKTTNKEIAEVIGNIHENPELL